MGRYYSGDIDGKFWFGVQSSDAADRFGSTGFEPSYLEYYYEIDHLPTVIEEIEKIEEYLGDKKQILDNFFKNEMSYSDKDLKVMGISDEDLSEYADLLMGYKIKTCIEENGSCQFTAEL